MILSLLVSCTQTEESPDEEKNDVGEVHVGRRPGIYFDSEEELTTFLKLITKDAEDLAEYDVCEVFKDQSIVSGCVPGKDFCIPPGVVGTIESFRAYYDRFKHLGYFTVNDKSTVQTFDHTQYKNLSDPNLLIYDSLVKIDDIEYIFYLWNKDDAHLKTKPEYKLVKKSKLLGKDINLYENTSKDLAWIFGSVNIGEFTVDIRVYVDSDNKEEIDKINLEQFVWKDYYEEEVKFDD